MFSNLLNNLSRELALVPILMGTFRHAVAGQGTVVRQIARVAEGGGLHLLEAPLADCIRPRRMEMATALLLGVNPGKCAGIVTSITSCIHCAVLSVRALETKFRI